MPLSIGKIYNTNSLIRLNGYQVRYTTGVEGENFGGRIIKRPKFKHETLRWLCTKHFWNVKRSNTVEAAYRDTSVRAHGAPIRGSAPDKRDSRKILIYICENNQVRTYQCLQALLLFKPRRCATLTIFVRPLRCAVSGI